MSSRTLITANPPKCNIQGTLAMSHGKQFTLFTHVGGPNGW